MQRIWIVVLSVWAMLAIVAVLAWSSRPAASPLPAASAQSVLVKGANGKQHLVACLLAHARDDRDVRGGKAMSAPRARRVARRRDELLRGGHHRGRRRARGRGRPGRGTGGGRGLRAGALPLPAQQRPVAAQRGRRRVGPVGRRLARDAAARAPSPRGDRRPLRPDRPPRARRGRLRPLVRAARGAPRSPSGGLARRRRNRARRARGPCPARARRGRRPRRHRQGLRGPARTRGDARGRPAHRGGLVDLGGDIAVRGETPEGGAWRIAVADPRRPGRDARRPRPRGRRRRDVRPGRPPLRPGPVAPPPDRPGDGRAGVRRAAHRHRGGARRSGGRGARDDARDRRTGRGTSVRRRQAGRLRSLRAPRGAADPARRPAPRPAAARRERRVTGVSVAWLVARASGLVAFGLLTLTVWAGLAMSTRLLPPKRQKPLLALHRTLAWTGLSMVGLHIVGLLLDPVMHFGALSVLVPGAAAWRPGAVALGVVAGWLSLALAASFKAQALDRPKGLAPAPLRELRGLLAGARTCAARRNGPEGLRRPDHRAPRRRARPLAHVLSPARPAQGPRESAGACARRRLAAAQAIRSGRARRADPLLGERRPALRRVPRRGVGTAGARRARPLRAALPRGLPGRARVDHDLAQARGVPHGLRRLRPGARRAVRRTRRRAAARRCRHRPPPRQDRGGDRERTRDARAARGGDPARRADVGVPRRRRRSRALETAQERRLPLRRPDDRLLGAGGLRDRQRPPQPTAGCTTRWNGSGMLDDRVRAVLERLEQEDAEERRQGVARELRARQVEPTTGRFLLSLVAPQTDCEVLELGGSRGYSTIWLAAGVRHLGGRVLSVEHDPLKAEAWRRNVDGGRRSSNGRRSSKETRSSSCRRSTTCSTSSSSTPRRTTTRSCSGSRADKVEPGALFVADNVLSHPDPLAQYSRRASGRPDARERDRAARPRARAERRAGLM